MFFVIVLDDEYSTTQRMNGRKLGELITIHVYHANLRCLCGFLEYKLSLFIPCFPFRPRFIASIIPSMDNGHVTGKSYIFDQLMCHAKLFKKVLIVTITH